MPDLSFQVESAAPELYAVAPTLNLKLKISQTDGGKTPIHTVALRCQVRIEPGRRKYTDSQKQSLYELFGAPHQWAQTVHPMLWTHTSTLIPAFAGSTISDLPVPCSYDFNLAATKYFDALGSDGEVPLCLLFSGTIFYQDNDGPLQVAPISWNSETDYRLPLRVWREMMDRYYPNSAWICLNKDAFDRLRQFKTQTGQVTLDQALEKLLDLAAEEKVPR